MRVCVGVCSFLCSDSLLYISFFPFYSIWCLYMCVFMYIQPGRMVEVGGVGQVRG